MVARSACVAVLLSASVALAQDCPQHLTPDLAGWLPPPVCEGLGRNNDLTQAEVQHERDLFQGNGYAADVLACWRTHLLDPWACLGTATASYHAKQALTLVQEPGAAACLVDDLATDAHRLALDDWLWGAVYPVLYAEATNTAKQKAVSNALAGAFKNLAKTHLERAIDETWEWQAIAAEAKVMTTYRNAVDGITGAPAALTVQAAFDLGDALQGWMDAHSNLAFCAN